MPGTGIEVKRAGPRSEVFCRDRLEAEVERFWDECRGTGPAVVPIVMTGWDRRPRGAAPGVLGEPAAAERGDGEVLRRADDAGVIESRHLRNAVEWMEAHPDAGEAKAILIYAWNENDEGGWLAPTRSEGRRRLRAVKSAVRNAR